MEDTQMNFVFSFFENEICWYHVEVLEEQRKTHTDSPRSVLLNTF